MKTILVFYIGIKDIPPADLESILTSVSKHYNKHLPIGEYLWFIIPVNSSSDSWIDCINPVLLNEQEYQDTKDKLQFIQEQFKNISIDIKNEIVDIVAEAANNFYKEEQPLVERKPGSSIKI